MKATRRGQLHCRDLCPLSYQDMALPLLRRFYCDGFASDGLMSDGLMSDGLMSHVQTSHVRKCCENSPSVYLYPSSLKGIARSGCPSIPICEEDEHTIAISYDSSSIRHERGDTRGYKGKLTMSSSDSYVLEKIFDFQSVKSSMNLVGHCRE